MIVRQANAADFPKIHKLFKENEFLDEGMTLEKFIQLYNWLYIHPPQKIYHELVLEKAEDSENVYGHHGLTPFAVQIENQMLWGGLAANLLIDSKQRNALLFMTLQKQFFRTYNKAGFNFVYGLVTRPDVLATHLKTGYKKMFEIPIFAKPIHFTGLVKKKISPFLGGLLSPLLKCAEVVHRLIFGYKNKKYKISSIATFTPEHDLVCRKFLNQWPIQTLRNHSILNWRYTQLDFRNYQIFELREEGQVCGLMILRNMPMKEFSATAIVDLIWDPENSNYPRALISFATEYARESGSDLMAAIFTPDKRISQILYKSGFIKTPEKFTLVMNEPNQQNAVSQTIKRCLDENKVPWLISWFDHDYV